jgi:hypothetical protein
MQNEPKVVASVLPVEVGADRVRLLHELTAYVNLRGHLLLLFQVFVSVRFGDAEDGAVIYHWFSNGQDAKLCKNH